MLKICLFVWKSEPSYAYKRYAYKNTCIDITAIQQMFKWRKGRKSY